MSMWARIKFAYKVYRGLIPAIWRSWRAEPYPPPTREEVLEFMQSGFGGRPVSTTPTCEAVLRNPGRIYSHCFEVDIKP